MRNCKTDDPLPKWKFILMLNVYGIITVIALLGSYFVIRAFHKFQNLRTASNNILVSLSIADGLLAIPLILDIIQLCLDYNGGNLWCILKRVRGTVTLFLPSVIVLHLTLMSSERFIAIKFALRYQAIVTKRRARIVSIVMWLWALVVKLLWLSQRCFREQQQANISDSTSNRIFLYSKLCQCFLSPCWSFYARPPTSSQCLTSRDHLSENKAVTFQECPPSSITWKVPALSPLL